MYNQKLEFYNNKINRMKGTREQLEKELIEKESEIKNLEIEVKQIIEVKKIVDEVAEQFQKNIQFYIEDIVNMVIDIIYNQNFEDQYKFILENEYKRNKSEINFYLLDKNEHKSKIKDTVGGGLCDIISFGLRISLFSLKKKKSNVLILDEPFKFLSKNLHKFAGEVIQKLSEKLGVQFIIITHSVELSDYGDNVIQVKKVDDISKIGVKDV